MRLSRRDFLARTASAAFAAAAAPLAAQRERRAAGARPNVLVIICDDLGWGDLGVYFQNARRAAGAAAERTPNLDQMAATGARLTDHYCAAPVCAPSRASLLLGVTQGHANVRDNQFDKALEDNHTLASVLRAAGYATAAVGKWGLQGAPADRPPNWPAHPLKRGFDYFYGYMRHRDGHQHYPIGDPWPGDDKRFGSGPGFPHRSKPAPYFRLDTSDGNGPNKQVWENEREVSAGLERCYTADLFTARAKRWLVEHRTSTPDSPFFLYLAFDTPHPAIELPAQAYPSGGGLKGGLQWVGEAGRMINTASGRPDSYLHPAFADAAAAGGRPWPDINKRYATSVRRIDDCVGDLLELLEDLRIARDTIVLFTSDHGPETVSYLPAPITPEFFSSYGPFDGIKRDCWEGGMRVPAIVRWPGRIPAGRVIGAPCASCDWLPTLAEIAGVPSPARTDGVSLLPELTGEGRRRAPEFLYSEYFFAGTTPDFAEFEPGRRNQRRNQMQMVRIGNLAGTRCDIQSAGDNFEIYDVVSDPKQKANLASDARYAPMQRRMKELVVQCRRPDPEAPRPYDHEPMAPAGAGVLAPGVEWRYYAGAFPWLPDWSALAPARSGFHPRPDLSLRRRDDRFGFLFTGYLEALEEGVYTFYVAATTGAFLRLHQAAVIDADFGYAGVTERAGAVTLKAGLHPFRLSYYAANLAVPMLALSWQCPGGSKQPVPDRAFRRPAT